MAGHKDDDNLKNHYGAIRANATKFAEQNKVAFVTCEADKYNESISAAAPNAVLKGALMGIIVGTLYSDAANANLKLLWKNSDDEATTMTKYPQCCSCVVVAILCLETDLTHAQTCVAQKYPCPYVALKKWCGRMKTIGPKCP